MSDLGNTMDISSEQATQFCNLVLAETLAGKLHWRSYRGRHYVADHRAGLLTVVLNDDIPGVKEETETTFMVESSAVARGVQPLAILRAIEERERLRACGLRDKDRVAVLQAIKGPPL